MDAPIRVLHVDDDPAFADLTATVLEREMGGFEVETATDAETGLNALAEREFDCVVSDYEMPNTDGIEFLDAVRESFPELPFVLFTGEGSEQVASEAISAGVTDYLQKGTGVGRYELLANRIENAVERYRTERELRRSRERYRRLVEEAPAPILLYEVDGTISDANAAAVEFFDAETKSELLGVHYSEIIHPDERELVDSRLRRLTEHGETAPPTEQRLLALDGSTKHAVVASTPVNSPDGSIYQTMLYDVTERRERERELYRQKQKVEGIHEVATEIERRDTPQAVYDLVVDAAESVLEFDVAVADEVVDEALVPRAISSTISEDQYYEETAVDDDGNLAARALRTGEPSVVDDVRETDFAPADSKFRAALTVPIGDYGVFQSVSDVPGAFDDDDRELVELLAAHACEQLARIETEEQLREQTAELERQNERLEEFVSVVSHDLRNPLNLAEGHLALAREDRDSERLATVAAAHEQMETLIEDLLAFARAGQRALDEDRVELADLTRNCWEAAVDGEATLVVDIDSAIEGDPDRVAQILENLLCNAAEHGGPDVTVTVGTTDDGFYVADDGPGISADESERVFDRGYSTASSGTGFGLSIVRAIAEAHGWSVAAVESDDGGARFEIRDATVVD